MPQSGPRWPVMNRSCDETVCSLCRCSENLVTSGSRNHATCRCGALSSGRRINRVVEILGIMVGSVKWPKDDPCADIAYSDRFAPMSEDKCTLAAAVGFK